MRDGKLLQTGTPQQLLQAPADASVTQMLDTPKRRARRLADLLRGHPWHERQSHRSLGLGLPDYLSQHVLLSVTALALGVAISLLWALPQCAGPACRPWRWAQPAFMQTIPGLALLGLVLSPAAGAFRC